MASVLGTTQLAHYRHHVPWLSPQLGNASAGLFAHSVITKAGSHRVERQKAQQFPQDTTAEGDTMPGVECT